MDEPIAAALAAFAEQRHSVGFSWVVEGPDRQSVGALGSYDVAGTRAVTVDTIYRIASLTKPIVATAALILVDRGVLAIDEPIARLLPELAAWSVLADPRGPLDVTVPARRPVTVEDLLTSRLGIGWDFGAAPSFDQPVMIRLAELGAGVGPPRPQASPPTDEWLSLLAVVPLERQPGERWLYDTSFDVLGAVVERAGGARLGDVLDELVFAPLGMVDTAFAVADDTAGRLGDCFAFEDGELVVYDPADGEWRHRARRDAGNGGLVSTVVDFARFARSLFAGELLSRDLRATMLTNQLTAEQLAASAPEPGGVVGWGYGLGVRVTANGAEPVGTYGWEGGLGATWHTDPATGRTAILCTNTAWLDPTGARIRDAFLTAAFTS